MAITWSLSYAKVGDIQCFFLALVEFAVDSSGCKKYPDLGELLHESPAYGSLSRSLQRTSTAHLIGTWGHEISIGDDVVEAGVSQIIPRRRMEQLNML